MKKEYGNLVLTRKINQRIFVGTNVSTEPLIIIKPTRIHQGQVVLSIVAPDDFYIFREEVYNRILSEKRISSDDESYGNK